MVNFKQIRILTTLLLTLLCTLPITAAGNPKLSSPIYLATVLVNKPTLDDMKDLCHYYSLTPAPEEDGYTVYTAPDGSQIRFKMVDKSGATRQTESTDNNRLTSTSLSAHYRSLTPIVEVETKESKKKISSILKEAGFTQTPDGYESSSRFVPNRTHISLSKNRLTLTKN